MWYLVLLILCNQVKLFVLQVAQSQAGTQALQATQLPAMAGMQQILLVNPSQLTTLQPQFMIQPTAGVVSRISLI
jgi:hypothetical protein